MVVGVCRISILMHGNNSLKGKRQVVKSIIEKVKNRFNVSMAEVEDNDAWQKAVIGFAIIGNDKAHINSSIDKVLAFVEALFLADVAEHSIELINC